MSDQPKPSLLIMSKDALKELDGAKMRDKTLKKYDAVLPSEMDDHTKNKRLPEGAGRIMVALGRGRELKDDEVQQMEMVARMLNGEFGPDARAVGAPDWLVEAVGKHLGEDTPNPISKSALNIVFDPNGLGVGRGGEQMLAIDEGVKAAKLEDQRQGRMAKLKKKVFGGVEDSWKSARSSVQKLEKSGKRISRDL